MREFHKNNAPTMYVHIVGTVFSYTEYVISFIFSASWNGVTITDDEKQ
jgi:hypothetical protein